MTRITKQIATHLAKQLLKPINEKLKKKEDILLEEIRKQASKHIPKEILIAFEKHPQYFEKLRFSDCGIHTSIDLPKRRFGYYNIESTDLDKTILKKLTNYEKEIKEKDSKFSQLEELIYTLRTKKRLQEDFPEAYALLPEDKDKGKQLMIPMGDIKAYLGLTTKS